MHVYRVAVTVVDNMRSASDPVRVRDMSTPRAKSTENRITATTAETMGAYVTRYKTRWYTFIHTYIRTYVSYAGINQNLDFIVFACFWKIDVKKAKFQCRCQDFLKRLGQKTYLKYQFYFELGFELG